MKQLRLVFLSVVVIAGAVGAFAEAPRYEDGLIFPLDNLHNHGSCIVECPNGDLLVCWFRGSGERQSDDVAIYGARKVKATGRWSEMFVMADTPEFPDTNCCMIIDRQERLWLLWPTIQANTWESALMKYKVSTEYMMPEGSPKWDYMEILHAKPGDDFEEKVKAKAETYIATVGQLPEELSPMIQKWMDHIAEQASDKLTRRLGWFTRAHPKILDDGRMLVGLYSDGFSFSLVAITDDWGKSWQFSEPIVGGGNIQPSFATKKDGTIVSYMRDNGPPPKRVLVSESTDRGKTWSTVYDHPEFKNPGSGLELANLNNGDWICIYNDTSMGRHSLAVSLSTDDGATWTTRHLENHPGGTGSFHYPSIMQGADGTIHASYSYFIDKAHEGNEETGKSIKHAAFNREWIMQGD